MKFPNHFCMFNLSEHEFGLANSFHLPNVCWLKPCVFFTFKEMCQYGTPKPMLYKPSFLHVRGIHKFGITSQTHVSIFYRAMHFQAFPLGALSKDGGGSKWGVRHKFVSSCFDFCGSQIIFIRELKKNCVFFLLCCELKNWI